MESRSDSHRQTEESSWRRLIRVGFWAALVLTFTNAILPSREAVRLIAWDKAEHFVAFFVLTLLAAVAYPSTKRIWIGISLLAFGAAIEVTQGFSIVSRDRDFWDWATDTIAVVAALAPIAPMARHRRVHSRPDG
jgi:VanZ family protein